ncbi:MAG TPA: protein-glutamate O-methyltransferase CheR [Chryseosolibacter sp.]|nr:protein-glutamate O-methyltransferase CheR [Chryseosolibacter sp.]
MQDIDIADLKRISELIYQKYNFDFRNYAMSSFKRRVVRILELKRLSPTNLLKALSETPVFIHEFVDQLTVNVTEMFRDPGFWTILRQEIIPTIRATRKRFKIWHAGCSSGEEVLTMCVLLSEMGILEDVSITATDLDENMLRRAEAAAYPIKNMQLNEQNYLSFGGQTNGLQRNYFLQQNGHAIFNRELLSEVAFMRHDLVTGQVFDTFDLILCRNVMIYFNQGLQNDVLKKFHESLYLNGYLAIGSKESLIWCDYANRFTMANKEEKVYKKLIA